MGFEDLCEVKAWGSRGKMVDRKLPLGRENGNEKQDTR